MRVGRFELDALRNNLIDQWLKVPIPLIKNQRVDVTFFSRWLGSEINQGGGSRRPRSLPQVRLPSGILKKSKKWGKNFRPLIGVRGSGYV